MLSVRDPARLNLAASALRVVLIVLLLGIGLMAEQQRTPEYGSLTRLFEDVRDHRVEVIEYRYDVSGKNYDLSVRWSTGLFSWWEFSEEGNIGPVPKELLEANPDEYAGPQGYEFESDLRRAMGQQKIDIRPYPDELTDDGFWPQTIAKGLEGALVGMMALALFGVMFATRDHRYANRWAWFWMFLASPLGMLGYLWLEKRPFPPPLPPRARAPIGGCIGFCCSVGLSFLLEGATALAAWLVN
jgi:hypothetical protein